MYTLTGVTGPRRWVADLTRLSRTHPSRGLAGVLPLHPRPLRALAGGGLGRHHHQRLQRLTTPPPPPQPPPPRARLPLLADGDGLRSLPSSRPARAGACASAGQCAVSAGTAPLPPVTWPLAYDLRPLCDVKSTTGLSGVGAAPWLRVLEPSGHPSVAIVYSGSRSLAERAAG
jgi:hypothetical protein